MKFSCLSENLSKGLQVVTKAVPAKSALPILSNVLIEAKDNRIRLAATNLETAIITYITASVEEEGITTVPAKLLKDFISNLSPNTVNFKLEKDILHAASEKTKTKFNGTDSKDYPELPDFSKAEAFLELEPHVFSNAVNLVGFAAGTDESRPVFTGTLLRLADGVLTIASTDGFRLSEKNIKVESKKDTFNIVIPSKTLLEVVRIFSSATENIKMALNDDQNLCLFWAEDTFVATRVLDGQYPDYKRIIPSESVLKAVFLSQDFNEAVKLTNIFAKEGSNAVKIAFDPEGIIRIGSLSGESGQHESSIEAEIEGELMEVAFSSKYLMEFLANVKSEKIIFQTNGNVSPCLLKTGETLDYLHIIMPMQL